MSAIFSRSLKRVSLTKFFTQKEGLIISSSPSRHFFLQKHVKWCHGYTHGLPGIPNDGKVIRLKNSTTGSDLYLVGTCHISQESVKTVKKVIDSVRPDVVAVELCMRRAKGLLHWKPEDDELHKLFLRSKNAPGGLRMKIGIFILNFWYRQLRADGIFPGQEFKVAMEESFKVNARCFSIDQDIGVLLQQLSKIFSFNLLWRSYVRARDESEKLDLLLSHYTDFKDLDYTRSSVREITNFQKKVSPEIFKVLIEDRDKLMFTKLRRFRGKVVAVVGMGHMDGIELLWKHAEDDNNKQPPVTSENAGQPRASQVGLKK